jgi:hypothetical protein
LNLIFLCSPDVEDHIRLLAGIENPTELRTRVARHVLAADRHTESNSPGGPRTPIENLQDALAVCLNKELDAQKGLLRQ